MHSSLGIRSTLKKQALKHNVIDRDKVLIPPGWDSWGKIRVLREGFDVEGTSSGWTVDISASPRAATNGHVDGSLIRNGHADNTVTEGTVLPLYEATVPKPSSSTYSVSDQKPQIEISVPNMQTFLASQQETLAHLAAEDEASSPSAFATNTTSTSLSSHERTAEHIGPIQVNMGGIQVDADDVVRKLQSHSRRDASSTSSSKDSEAETPKGKGEGASMSTPDMKAQNEALQSFFSGLMKRGASNSPRGTPGKGKEGGK